MIPEYIISVEKKDELDNQSRGLTLTPGAPSRPGVPGCPASPYIVK